MVNLAGSPVLITGATGGIGRAVAERLAEHGARLHVLSRSPAALADLASSSGGRAWSVDLSDDAEVWAALDELTEWLAGPPHAVVNAAGAFDLEPLASTSIEVFDRNLEVNLRGPFLVIRALLPAMLARGRGRIVNVGSVAGRQALPGNAAYAASKFGLRGLHEVLVLELKGTGVSATLVEPSATDTGLWDALGPEAREGLPSRSAMLPPGAVADAVLFALTRPAEVALPLIQIARS